MDHRNSGTPAAPAAGRRSALTPDLLSRPRSPMMPPLPTGSPHRSTRRELGRSRRVWCRGWLPCCVGRGATPRQEQGLQERPSKPGSWFWLDCCVLWCRGEGSGWRGGKILSCMKGQRGSCSGYYTSGPRHTVLSHLIYPLCFGCCNAVSGGTTLSRSLFPLPSLPLPQAAKHVAAESLKGVMFHNREARLALGREVAG